MTGMFRITRSLVVVIVAVCLSSQMLLAQQGDLPSTNGLRSVDRLALLGEVYANPPKATTKAPVKPSEPIPFSISAMTGDLVPPFAAHPTLQPVAESDDEDQISFEENIPVEPKTVDSIDDCCRELTEMIAGNLDSEISLDAKKRMIETALKMVARNVALKAEAKITKLNADHALEMARMQGQMGQMRSVSSAADQINRVAGPLSQILQKNYQQSVASNLANQQLSQSLAQLGFSRLEEEARVTRSNRQRIQLKTPQPNEPDANQWQVERLNQEIARLQRQLDDSNRQPATRNEIQPASYSQPLQPRRQPLEPSRTSNEYFQR